MTMHGLFNIATRNASAGLMQLKKKHMERMAEVVSGSCDQSLQHCLSNSGGMPASKIPDATWQKRKYFYFALTAAAL